MTKWFWLAGAGALGTLARAGLAGAVQRLAGGLFPWGTLLVNALGCLLFGFFWALGESRSGFSAEHRAVVLTGFMGAFTTFSTFVFDSTMLTQTARIGLALGNVASSLLLGVAFLLVGLAVGRAV